LKVIVDKINLNWQFLQQLSVGSEVLAQKNYLVSREVTNTKARKIVVRKIEIRLSVQNKFFLSEKIAKKPLSRQHVVNSEDNIMQLLVEIYIRVFFSSRLYQRNELT